MTAADLVRLVETLRAPYGLERSAKFVDGALYDDRCLISLHRDAFGPQPAARLAAMAAELGMPPGFAERIPEALDRAEVVHFGHEAGGGALARKLYFEYANDARRAAARREPSLVHLAFKWAPGRAQCAVARYTSAPCASRAEIEARLTALTPPASAPRALRAAMALVARVAPAAEAGQLPLMQVEEADNPRQSYDINVYDCAIRVGGAFDLIEATARDFAAPLAQVRETFGRARRSALGHLSAGRGRDGREFVTFYFGVEGRRGSGDDDG